MPFTSPSKLEARSAPRDRRLALGIAWVALTALVGLALPVLGGKVFVGDDLGGYHLPCRAFYQQCLRAGDRFDWMPTLYCGFDLTGEGQAGVYHPWHWLLYRWLPLNWAFDLEVLANYPLLFFGCFLLFRQHLRRPAALLGAMLFAGSSFCLLHLVHVNAIAVVAHLPWLMWAAGVMVRRPKSWASCLAFAGIALGTGSQLLLGYPQYVWFSLLAEFAYLVCLVRGSDSYHPGALARANDRASTLRLRWVTTSGQWMLAKVWGLLLGAVQLLPTYVALRHSTRSAADAGFFSNGSLHPLNLVQLIAPYLFETRVVGQNTHELSLYVGAVPLLLIVWMVFARGVSRRLRRMFWIALSFSGAALLLAMGEHSFLFRLQSWLPVVGQFRFPCRAIVLVELGLAAASACGFQALLRRESKAAIDSPRGGRPIWIVAAGAALAALAAAVCEPQFVASWPLVVAGPAIFLVAAGFLHAALAGRRWAVPALILFAAFDLMAYGLSYRPNRQFANLPDVAATDAPPQTPSRISLACAEVDHLRLGNQLLLAGNTRVDGYAGLEPARRLDYRQAAALNAAGAQFYAMPPIDAGRTENFVWHSVVPGTPLPRAQLVAQAKVSSNPAVDIEAISLRDCALVDEELDLPWGLPGDARVVRDRPGCLQIAVDCPSQQLLVLTESFHPGWRATVDGEAATPRRVNGDFLGCVVPAGRHQVDLEFRPASLRWGGLMSACGLGLLGMLVAIGLGRTVIPS